MFAASYHLPLDTASIQMMEQGAFNFYTLTGRKMQIPPRLFEDLRSGGMTMTHVEANENLTDSLLTPGD